MTFFPDTNASQTLMLRQDVSSWVHLKGSSSANLAKEYYKDVTRRQMLELYRRYQPDFELFEYDIDDFLAIAKEEWNLNVVVATALNDYA